MIWADNISYENKSFIRQLPFCFCSCIIIARQTCRAVWLWLKYMCSWMSFYLHLYVRGCEFPSATHRACLASPCSRAVIKEELQSHNESSLHKPATTPKKTHQYPHSLLFITPQNSPSFLTLTLGLVLNLAWEFSTAYLPFLILYLSWLKKSNSPIVLKYYVSV